MSCHFEGGVAANVPFSTGMQPGGGLKTSHSWSGSMPNSTTDQGANNPFGLRTSDQVSDANVITQLGTYGFCSVSPTTYTSKSSCTSNGGTWTAQVVCSTCHSVMAQTNAPWDPGAAPVVTGTATGGSTTSVADSNQSWTPNAWVGYYVKMTSGSNNRVIQHIAGNTSTTLTLAQGASFPSAVVSGNTYGIMPAGKHFMREANSQSEMCEDCHYYRSAAWTTLSDVKTYDGNKKSHPVAKNLTTDVANPDLFIGAVPYEPKCAAACSNSAWTTVGACTGNGGTWDPQYCRQTGSPRYHQNGGADTNSTNNIVFDADGKIRCMSCHGVHYTDSKSRTVDKP